LVEQWSNKVFFSSRYNFIPVSEENNLSKYNSFRLLCLQNANDNYKAAKLLVGQNVNHLVVHLSILCLEEVGKIFMSFIKLTQKEKWEDSPLKVPLDDHKCSMIYPLSKRFPAKCCDLAGNIGGQESAGAGC
jgi:hypothetical protein